MITIPMSQSSVPKLPNVRRTETGSENWEVVAVNISPEMGERIMISGSR